MLVKVIEVDETVNEGGTFGSCVTVTVRLSTPGALTVIVPVRAVELEFTEDRIVNEPLPDPDEESIVSHDALLSAVQSVLEVTVITVDVAFEGKLIEPEGDIVQVGCFCVTVKV